MNSGAESFSILLTIILFVVVPMIGIWKIFSKAGIPGFLAFIPIVNIFLLFTVAKKPWYAGFLLLIPLVNLIVICILYYELCRVYGKGILFALGLLFLPMIFFPILGFSADKEARQLATA